MRVLARPITINKLTHCSFSLPKITKFNERIICDNGFELCYLYTFLLLSLSRSFSTRDDGMKNMGALVLPTSEIFLFSSSSSFPLLNQQHPNDNCAGSSLLPSREGFTFFSFLRLTTKADDDDDDDLLILFFLSRTQEEEIPVRPAKKYTYETKADDLSG